MFRDLERRYDGPIPPDLLDPARPDRRATANAAWHDRAAHDARRDIARRRATVKAAEVLADGALIRMVGMLAGYRAAPPA